jgi:hypothetical protein
MDLDEHYRSAFEQLPQLLMDELGERLVELDDDELTRLIRDAVVTASRDSAKSLARKLRDNGPDMLKARRADRVEFEERLASRWGAAFDLAEMAMVVAYEAGEAFHKKHWKKAEAENDLVFAALVRLHARACRISEEVLVLLKSGFGQAAMARWRVLHEVTAVAFFIKQHGQETAERYFAHEGMESWRAMEEYQKHAERLGYEPYSDDEMTAARDRYDALCARYGKGFAGPYGWAQADLAASNPRFVKDRATISAIEADVGLAHLRPHYRMASHGTHANPKGITFTPDVLPDRPVLLAGPGVAGLADPGACALISLAQVTGALLTYKSGESAGIVLGALLELTDAAEGAYWRANEAVSRGSADDTGSGTSAPERDSTTA